MGEERILREDRHEPAVKKKKKRHKGKTRDRERERKKQEIEKSQPGTTFHLPSVTLLYLLIQPAAG